MSRRFTAFAVLSLAALAGCSNKSEQGSQGTTQNPPENQGMREGAGVGDNAPGGSDSGPIQNGAAPTSTSGDAMEYPATGKR